MCAVPASARFPCQGFHLPSGTARLTGVVSIEARAPYLRWRMALTAKDVMTTRLVTVDADTTLLDLEGRLRVARVGGAPVVDDGKFVGIISRSDVARQLTIEDTYAEVARELLAGDEGVADQIGHRLKQLRVGDAMVTDVATARPDTPVVELARKMLDERHRRIIVKGDDDAVLGIVTSSDIVRLVADGRLSEG